MDKISYKTPKFPIPPETSWKMKIFAYSITCSTSVKNAESISCSPP